MPVNELLQVGIIASPITIITRAFVLDIDVGTARAPLLDAYIGVANLSVKPCVAK